MRASTEVSSFGLERFFDLNRLLNGNARKHGHKFSFFLKLEKLKLTKHFKIRVKLYGGGQVCRSNGPAPFMLLSAFNQLFIPTLGVF